MRGEGIMIVRRVNNSYGKTVCYRISAQMGASGSAAIYQTHNLKVRGSNPLPATKLARNFNKLRAF